MMASAASRWLAPDFEPEDVARQVERADLAPTVGKQLVAAYRAGDNLVDVFRGLILAVDFLVFPVAELAGHEACVPGNGRKRIGGGYGDGQDLVDDNGGAERLVEHGPSPLRRMANCYRVTTGLKI